MEYRRLGKTGVKVSVLSYGAWVSFGNQLGLGAVKELLQTAQDGGVNFWDNAEVYASGQAETLMGQAIKDLGWRREDHVVSTKLFWGGKGPNDVGLGRKHIVEGIKNSLKRLQMDYVDLLFCHRPDPDTPIEETVRAMNWVLDQGWAFYWGTSEWSAAQLQEAVDISKELGLVPPQFEQPEYNLFARNKGLTTWSPLASGVLTGKYSGGAVPEGSRMTVEAYKGLAQRKLVEQRDKLDLVDQLKPVADDLGCSLAQLALAWCAKNPHVSTVITGATKPQQITENLKALEVLPKLTPDVLDRIEGIVKTKPTPQT